MAQGDLYRLLQRVSKAVKSDVENSKVIREEYKKVIHDVVLSKANLKREITLQIQDFKAASQLPRSEPDKYGKGGGKLVQAFRREVGGASKYTREGAQQFLDSKASTEGLSTAVVAAIDKEAEYILVSAARLAKEGKASTTVNIKKISGDGINDLVLRYYPKRRGNNADIYEAVNKTIVQPSKARMKILVQKLLSLTEEETKDVAIRFFNVGHVKGVAEHKIAKKLESIYRELNRVDKAAPINDTAKEAANLIRMEILSKFTQFGNPEVRKEFRIRAAVVRPESETANQTDSVYEAQLLETLKKSLKSTLEQLPNDWANQKSSNSVVDLLSNEILSVALKRGGKISSPIKRDLKDSKVENSQRINQPKNPRTSQRISVKVPEIIFEIKSTVSLVSLIPIINQRLPDIIKNHMGQSGRLRNRTGRFAESAEVVGGDDFGLTYTYQRNPYQVFESQGARDPRPLIEQSIREIAIGLTASKFNLRRV